MNPFHALHNKNIGRNRLLFVPAELQETNRELVNPSRGWYEIYSFNIDEEPDFNELKWCLREKESVILILINLWAARENTLSGEQLVNADNILSFFNRAGKDIILRFTYDTAGEGSKNEPETILTILTHIRQLGEVVRKYKKSIFVLQGLFIGSWGEMHTSSYTSPDNIKKLAAALNAAVGNDVFMAFRKPAQLRCLLSKEEFKKGIKEGKFSNVGLFNDGMFGSHNHLGTFGVNKRSDSHWEDSWSIEDEMEFEDSLCSTVPNGGEVIYGDDGLNTSLVLSLLKKMHISYLNCVHDSKMLDCWKEEIIEEAGIWKGESLYDYIGRHLGYRIVIKGAEVKLKSASLARITVEFENIGFAPLYDSVEFVLQIMNGTYSSSEKEREVFREDFSEIIKPDKKYTFQINVPVGEGELYLGMQRKKDGKFIEFATVSNKDSGKDRLLYIGEFISQ